MAFLARRLLVSASVQNVVEVLVAVGQEDERFRESQRGVVLRFIGSSRGALPGPD